MLKTKNGIPLLDKNFQPRTKQGCNTGKCPPLVKTTSSPRERKTGVSLAKYIEIWPSVKFKSTLG